jgi:hypothetical protein
MTSEDPREPGRTGIELLLAYADDFEILRENIDTTQKNTEALLDTSKKVGLEVNQRKLSIF